MLLFSVFYGSVSGYQGWKSYREPYYSNIPPFVRGIVKNEFVEILKEIVGTVVKMFLFLEGFKENKVPYLKAWCGL